MSVMLYFSSPGGGVQRGRIALANALLKRKGDVSCVMPTAKGPFLSKLDPRIRFYELGAKRNSLKATMRLATLLRKESPTAVLTSQANGAFTTVMARMIARTRTPIIACQHDVIAGVMQYGSGSTKLTYLKQARFAFRRAEKLVGISRGVAHELSWLTKRPMSDITVIPNTAIPLDVEQRKIHPTGCDWLDSGREKVLLSIGNLRPSKDHITLLRAFATVRKNIPVKLVILGNGDGLGQLLECVQQLHIAEDVCFRSNVVEPYGHLSRATALVHTARYEALGNVLIEALACGCPVISTDCPYGPREILDDGQYGQLVPVGQPGLIALWIQRYLSEPSQISATAMYQRAKHYALERSVQQYLTLLEAL